MLNLFYLISVISAIGNSIDNSTYANIEDVQTKHMSLDFTVDFDQKHFSGSVTHTMKFLKPGVKQIFMDIVGMDIHFISLRPCEMCYWEDAEYTITEPKPALGQALQITVH